MDINTTQVVITHGKRGTDAEGNQHWEPGFRMRSAEIMGPGLDKDQIHRTVDKLLNHLERS